MKKIDKRIYEHRSVRIVLTKNPDENGEEFFNFDAKIKPDHPDVNIPKTHSITLIDYPFERGLEVIEEAIDKSLDSSC